jgi:hypothetical protein
MSFFAALKKEAEFGRSNAQGLNYKLKVICTLNKAGGIETKEKLCIALSSINSEKPHPYFMSHPTVFDVLSKRLDLIVKDGDSYKFKGNLSQDQTKEIMVICQKRLRGLKE